MAEIAEVIVDVKARQVNRPFDYLIPSEYSDTIALGSRVIVPFGPRKVQGFVVRLKDQSEKEQTLKEILYPMDSEPSLSEELIQLGRFMADHYFAFMTQCYETMLPNALKSSYDRVFEWHNEPVKELNIHLPMTWQDAQQTNSLKTLLALKKDNKVLLTTIVKDKKTVKTETLVTRSLKRSQYKDIFESLRPNAKKQRELVMALSLQTAKTITKEALLKNYPILTQADLKSGEEKGWLTISKREVSRMKPIESDHLTRPLVLSNEQQEAYNRVLPTIEHNEHRVFLLEGVTGSGKTELYLQWIQEVLKKGKTALMLVPEIALTPQMTARFQSRFGKKVAVLHSGLSKGERFDEWRKIKRKEATVVVGARSAVFAPLDYIGIIILDEEHESSYQQSEVPHYHARDIAIRRGQYHDAPVILGSATPSLESRARAQKKVYDLLQLKHRPTKQSLPEVHLVDMRDALLDSEGHFSQPLLKAIKDRLKKEEQTVLLLNRRGFSSYVMCRSCGHVPMCPNCDISLTLHLDDHSLKCHYCGHQEPVQKVCPQCGSHDMRYVGSGTQQIERELKQLIPDIRVTRMDWDTTRKKNQHQHLLEEFADHRTDVLLGTQMIAKGLDYPNVTLVGVINADTGLYLPDFRAFEKTFQLLTQVSGRAGRGDKPGDVYIQTYDPSFYAIRLAKNQDYETFYEREMQLRYRGKYPPFYYTTLLSISAPLEQEALRVSYRLKAQIEKHISEDMILLGPSPKSIARINNRYYFQILLKYKKIDCIEGVLKKIVSDTQAKNKQDVYVKVEREPQNFM